MTFVIKMNKVTQVFLFNFRVDLSDDEQNLGVVTLK